MTQGGEGKTMEAKSRSRGLTALALAMSLGMSGVALTACGGQPDGTSVADATAEDGATGDGDGRIAVEATSTGATTPSKTRGGMITLKALCNGQDGKVAISRIDGSWLGTLHDDGSDVPFVWVRDESNGAYYRVSLAGYDFAVIWDETEDRGIVEFHRGASNGYRRHVVLHLPEDELGSFDGKSFDGTGDDEQPIQGDALERIRESASTAREKDSDDG